MRTNSTITLLIAGHLIVACCGAMRGLSRIHDLFSVSDVVVLSLLYAQAGLIGIWTGLAKTAIASRMTALCCGSAYLGIISAVAFRRLPREAPALLSCELLPMIALALILFLPRYEWTIAEHRCGQFHAPASRPMQFSVRQILMLTASVAILLALAKSVRWSAIKINYGGVFVVSAFLVVNAIAAVWACLGSTFLLSRLGLVLALALIDGFLITVSGNEMGWLAVWLLDVGIIVGSLLVVRSCGYRLVRSSRGNQSHGES